ncbi:MAG: methyltransferase domain-containing protein [Oscillospiraceae bacterium]|nr:methyltransferase domain-containing protein [Oscillospiraceae bacterium]
MLGHPGGGDHSRYLIELSFLPAGSRWLDMGAGDGETVRLLGNLGHEAVGIDLEPRGDAVVRGDFLDTGFESGSFDGIISQCAFYVGGDVPGALREAARLLRKGGKLVFSDVCWNVRELIQNAREAGFAVRHMEDLTDLWKEYYIEALWREEISCLPGGKGCSYVLFVCERM